jgi:hypothetical protein
MNEIYISMDIESDGPIPGPHSEAWAACRTDLELPEHAMAVLKTNYRTSTKRNMLKERRSAGT